MGLHAIAWGAVGDILQCGLQEPNCFTIGELVKAQAEALIPIMERYHVDVYDAGHVHSCKCARVCATSLDVLDS